MTSSEHKSRWKRAYDTQALPDTLPGGMREFNGYRLPRTYQLLQNSIRKATRHWQGRHVLDAGCGSGATAGFLKARNQVTGADLSQQLARFARQVYPGVAVADVEQLPFADNAFDGVIAVGVWQCLTPDTPFLAETRRVLRPGGEAVFGWMLNAEFLLYRNGLTFNLDPSVKLSLLDAEAMPRLLADAGLRVDRFYAALFPLGVLSLESVPRWLRPLVPAYTVRCTVDSNTV